MTAARPLRHPAPKQEGMRVLRGRKQLRRPALAPWMMMVLIGVAAFLGLGFARTSLDRSAFELDRLDGAAHARVGDGEETDERHHQQTRVEQL